MKYRCPTCGCYLFYLRGKDKVVVPVCADCENTGSETLMGGLIDATGFYQSLETKVNPK